MDHASRIMGLQWQVRRYFSKKDVIVAEMWQKYVHKSSIIGVAEGSQRGRRGRKKDLH